MRHKFFSLLEGHPATDDDCRALLTTNEGSAKAATAHRGSKLRPGKHNMAKGALRPEDAAVSVEAEVHNAYPDKIYVGIASEGYIGSKYQIKSIPFIGMRIFDVLVHTEFPRVVL